MSSDYKAFCEDLWRRWRDEGFCPSFTNPEFDKDYLPEPYLTFGDDNPDLCYLTTNPGGIMGFQNREAITSGKSIIDPKDSYHNISLRLSEYYKKQLKGASQLRIRRFSELSGLLSCQGFTQLECFPFHSQCLPRKDLLIRQSKENYWYKEYLNHLYGYMNTKNIIALSAVSSRSEINIHSIENNRWLSFLSGIMGFDLSKAYMIGLTSKLNMATSAFIYSRSRDNIKGFILMMGGNHMPHSRSLSIIAKQIKESYS